MSSDESSPDAEPQFEPGYLLQDRYEIRQPLGAGGFATVYEAWDTTIERRIAVKVLNIRELSRGSQPVELVRKRFLREARLSAKIRHSSVIEIYDFGVLEESEQPYMMMEYLEGKDLDEEIKNLGSLPADRLLPLFVEALEGLGEAHEQGVVHKDLKPANLFLTRPGTSRERLKVVDFGIAHVHEEVDERLTKSGAFTGTPYYLPQEYLQEQVVRPEMDVYQMGLILIEALTGQRAVVAETAYQAVVKHIQRDFEIPSLILEGRLGEIIRRSIAHEPEERFADAGEFAGALGEIDPASIAYQPEELDTAAAEAVTGQVEGMSGTGGAQSQVGGSDEEPEGGDEESEGDERPVSQSLGVDTINAAFGSTWPIKVLIGLGGAIVAVLVALGAVIATGGLDGEEADGGEETEVAAGAEPGEESRDESDDTLGAGEDSGAGDGSDESAGEPAEAETTSIAVESTPSGADVAGADGSIGTTPLEVDVEAGESRELTVAHPDYRSEELTVEAGAGDVEVTLEKREREETVEEPAEEPAGIAPEESGEPEPAGEATAEDEEPPVEESEPVADDSGDGDGGEEEDWAMPGAGDDDGESGEDGESEDDGYRLAP